MRLGKWFAERKYRNDVSAHLEEAERIYLEDQLNRGITNAVDVERSLRIAECNAKDIAKREKGYSERCGEVLVKAQEIRQYYLNYGVDFEGLDRDVQRDFFGQRSCSDYRDLD